MASSFHFSHLLFSLLFLSLSISQASSTPTALVIPVRKDATTVQHIISLTQRTPQVQVNLTIDVGAPLVWQDCNVYSSTTDSTVLCGSALCTLAGPTHCTFSCLSPPEQGCNNNTCSLYVENTITENTTSGVLRSDVVSVQSTDGKNPGAFVSDPNFVFACGSTPSSLEGLASGAQGMAGLGRSNISLSSQFTSYFNLNNTFSLCLSSSASSDGVLFFGSGPFTLLPNIVISESTLLHTPLIANLVSTTPVSERYESSSEYFIEVTSIQINQKTVPLNTSLLSVDQNGKGGTKISTVIPYTRLESSIFAAVTTFFSTELADVPRVPVVAPFVLCFNSTSIGSTRAGPAVPEIDLVLQNNATVWTIFGGNSMVQASAQALCLGFVDGGKDPVTSIEIGIYQIEENFLQFDLKASSLGFSSYLPASQTTCANFNFTSNA